VRNVAAAFSGSSANASEYEASLASLGGRIELIAVGVTEAGLAEGSPAMLLLARSLELLQLKQPQQRVSVIDLDNVSSNGDKIKRLMSNHFAASPSLLSYLSSSITFHNSVVDRITAARPNDNLVPRGEPIPHKVRHLFSLLERRMRLRCCCCCYRRLRCCCCCCCSCAAAAAAVDGFAGAGC
jgi:hypothetical protein